MSSDLRDLVRRDHDELDHILVALTDPATSTSEAMSLLEALQMGFGAHANAQCMALRGVLGGEVAPRALSMIVNLILDEHRNQARALAALAMVGAGTIAWTTHALALRVQLVDHARREEFMRASLFDHLSRESQRALASMYAADRLRRIVTLVAPSQLGANAFSLN